MIGNPPLVPNPGATEPSTGAATSDYMDFEVLSEPWSRYQLSDGTMLRLRFLLQKLRRGFGVPGQPGLQAANISAQTIVVSEAPQNLRGNPGRPIPQEEFDRHVEEEVSFRPVSTGPSIYRFEGTRVLTVDYAPTRVRRLDANGPDGDRQYVVETAASVSVVTLPPVLPSPAMARAGTPPSPAEGSPIGVD